MQTLYVTYELFHKPFIFIHYKMISTGFIFIPSLTFKVLIYFDIRVWLDSSTLQMIFNWIIQSWLITKLRLLISLFTSLNFICNTNSNSWNIFHHCSHCGNEETEAKKNFQSEQRIKFKSKYFTSITVKQEFSLN